MIVVLRLGHRLGRDARISTHVGLVSRALGADKIVYSGQKDEKMMESVRKITEEFGGPFEVEYQKNWKKVVEDFKGTKVHLTMYGTQYREFEAPKGNVLIVVGGEKVPGEIYHLVDHNVSVTNQPHSEVAALGIILDRMGIEKEFSQPKKRITPSERSRIIE